MPSLKRGYKRQKDKHKPEVVTGSFELHYEDVVQRNRFILVAVFTSALVLLAAFVPNAVYQSVARPDTFSAEAENGTVINAEFVTRVRDDISASENGYIEFHVPSPHR